MLREISMESDERELRLQLLLCKQLFSALVKKITIALWCMVDHVNVQHFQRLFMDVHTLQIGYIEA